MRLKKRLGGENMKKIEIPDVLKKQLKIVAYLLVSGGLGYGLALLAKKPELAIIFAPAINYILYTIVEELKKEGIIQALKNK